jgi:molybdopterin-guanine dinucleotide biosynthesis protein A
MGRDKAAIELGGQPLLVRVAAAAANVCDELVIAGGRRQPVVIRGLAPTWVEDPAGPPGPLAGLEAGLRAASNTACVVVACDMPFLNERLLGHLLEALPGTDAVVPLAGGIPQPLHAIYSRESLATVRALRRLGASSLRELLSRIRVRYVPSERCRDFDPEGLSWFNMNTPDELTFVSDQLRRRRRHVAAA